jgi:release factor glutamine methyltransferase
MRVACLARVPGRLAVRRRARAAAAAPRCALAATTPHPPLVERPASHAVTPADMVAWCKWAEGQIAAVGDGLTVDGGPSKDELRRELRWLLEDAVGDPPGWPAVRADLTARFGPGGDGGGDAAATIPLRTPLASLTDGWTARLHDRVPLQYVTGSAHWRDMVLAVGPGVLVPRPETEMLVDLAAAAAAAAPPAVTSLPWADAGTGSGALALGLAAVLPVSVGRVFASDASAGAAAWARLNVERLAKTSAVQVEVVIGDWLHPIPGATDRRLGGLVSNPPYIPRSLLTDLQPEVGRHEPGAALDGGDGDGTAAYAALLAAAPAALIEGGFLGLETHGHGQAERVADTLAAQPGAPWTDVRVVNDERGVARFVTAVRGA